MDRRKFMKIAGLSAAGIASTGLMPAAGAACIAEVPGWDRKDKDLFGNRPKGHFSIRQLSSVTDTIGNSHILQTKGGKVIVIDGGFATEQDNLRKNIAALGGHVDLWFITHPHQDHMGAFNEILKDRREITIDKVIYSRLPDSFLDREPENAADARSYYRTLDSVTEGVDILDLHRTGGRFDIDGIGIMVLGVANPELTMNPYNNQSMIIRLQIGRDSRRRRHRMWRQLSGTVRGLSQLRLHADGASRTERLQREFLQGNRLPGLPLAYT